MLTIEYYLSLNSPWAYLGSVRFAAIAKAHNSTVLVKPARYGVIFGQTGGLPLPKRSPQRQAYRLTELKRWSDYLGIPINIQPKGFPSDEAAASRLVIAAQQQGRDALAFAHELGKSLWELEQSFADPATIGAAAARSRIDLAAVRAASPPEAALDAAWDANTADGLARGIFGAPSYVLPTGEIFWGQDRLEFLERALRK